MEKQTPLSSLTPRSIERRQFISSALKTAGAAVLLGNPVFGAVPVPKNDMTIQDLIDLILKEIPGAPFPKTVDTIKSGSAANKLSGVVTTMFPTVEVIRQTISLKANFIIAHEPSFYNHLDDTGLLGNDKVVAAKLQLLKDNKITIWRFHDYWHSHRPDGIFYGVVKKAGWESYVKAGENSLTIPADSLRNIAMHLKAALDIDRLRVIGDMGATCSRITLMPGASGGKSQMEQAGRQKPDLLIVGELQEWETAEYIRDARSLGNNISLIVLGHAASEEPGMEWLVQWLQPRIPSIKVTHIPSGDPFVSV
jgi:putative NIF3 family GTP cyclohydrolase 1 type 2